MPTASEQMVLAACDKLAGHDHGFVLDSDIARKTGIALGTVQDCLRGLDREGHVDLVPLESGDLRASVTPRGRQELKKDAGIVRTPIPSPDIKGQVKVVPKGLRSYDEHDAYFFLELLPGPRDRDGLPESIRFWKAQIEEADPDQTFRVGLIYGPSVAANRRWSRRACFPGWPITSCPFISRSLPKERRPACSTGLRKRCPDLPTDWGWSSRSGLERGARALTWHKVLLVLDQFEQWLFTWRGDEEAGWSQPCDIATAVTSRPSSWSGTTSGCR